MYKTPTGGKILARGRDVAPRGGANNYFFWGANGLSFSRVSRRYIFTGQGGGTALIAIELSLLPHKVAGGDQN